MKNAPYYVLAVAAVVIGFGGTVTYVANHDYTQMADPVLLARTRCYAEIMLTPPWRLEVTSIRDSTLQVFAFTRWNTSTYRARVTFNLHYMDELDKGQAGEVIVHELSHLVLSELFELATRADSALAVRLNEQTATRIGVWDLWRKECS